MLSKSYQQQLFSLSRRSYRDSYTVANSLVNNYGNSAIRQRLSPVVYSLKNSYSNCLRNYSNSYSNSYCGSCSNSYGTSYSNSGRSCYYYNSKININCSIRNTATTTINKHNTISTRQLSTKVELFNRVLLHGKKKEYNAIEGLLSIGNNFSIAKELAATNLSTGIPSNSNTDNYSNSVGNNTEKRREKTKTNNRWSINEYKQDALSTATSLRFFDCICDSLIETKSNLLEDLIVLGYSNYEVMKAFGLYRFVKACKILYSTDGQDTINEVNSNNKDDRAGNSVDNSLDNSKNTATSNSTNTNNTNKNVSRKRNLFSNRDNRSYINNNMLINSYPEHNYYVLTRYEERLAYHFSMWSMHFAEYPEILENKVFRLLKILDAENNADQSISSNMNSTINSSMNSTINSSMDSSSNSINNSEGVNSIDNKTTKSNTTGDLNPGIFIFTVMEKLSARYSSRNVPLSDHNCVGQVAIAGYTYFCNNQNYVEATLLLERAHNTGLLHPQHFTVKNLNIALFALLKHQNRQEASVLTNSSMNDNSPLQVGSLYMNSDGSSETHNFRDNIIKEDSNLANNMNKSSSSNYYFPLLALLRVIPGNSFHEMLLREEILLKTARFGLIPTTISLMNVLLQSQLWVGTYVINLIMSMDGDQNKSSNLHRLIYLSMLEGKEYSAVIQSLDDVKQSISSNNSTISSNSTGIRTNSTKNSNNNQNKSMGTLDGFYNEYNERESLGKLNGLIAKLPPEDYAIGLHFSTLRKVLGSCIKCYTQLNKLADPTLIDQEKNRIVKILWLVNDIVKNNNLTVTTIFIQQYAELADRLKNIKLVIVALEWLINQGKIPSRELLAVRKALNDDNINYYWQLEDEYVHSSYFNYNKETVVPVGENLEKTQNGYDLIVNNDNDVLSNLLLNEPNKEKLTEGVSVDLSYLLVPRSIASQQTQDATIPKLRELEEMFEVTSRVAKKLKFSHIQDQLLEHLENIYVKPTPKVLANVLKTRLHFNQYEGVIELFERSTTLEVERNFSHVLMVAEALINLGRYQDAWIALQVSEQFIQMKTIETENILLQRNGINESTSVDINSSNDFVADHTTLSRGVFDIETLLTDDTTKSHILILSKYLNLLSSMNNKSSTTKDKVLPVVEDNGKEKITKENLLKAISYIVTTMFNTFPEESFQRKEKWQKKWREDAKSSSISHINRIIALLKEYRASSPGSYSELLDHLQQNCNQKAANLIKSMRQEVHAKQKRFEKVYKKLNGLEANALDRDDATQVSTNKYHSSQADNEWNKSYSK